MIDGVKHAVFFGAHTDDEMVCAGTLHRLVREGVDVTMVAFGPAGTREDPAGGVDAGTVLIEEFMRSASAIGASFRADWGGLLPSKTLHHRDQEISDRVFDYCRDYRPELAIILSPDDENPAHRAVGAACERVMRGRVRHVWRCQYLWNYSIGRSNLLVRLEPEDVEAKRAVIAAYQSQSFRYHYHDLFMSSARADGLSVKVEYAERFELLRGVL